MANQHAHPPQGEQEQQPQGRDAERPPFWEWVVAGIGLVLVAGSIGYLAWAAMTRAPGDVRPVVEQLAVQPQEGRFLVRIRVTNRGSATAEGLKVTGTLKEGGQEVERSETEFQYLPGHSTREAGLLFGRDPRALQLELQAESFRQP